MKSNKPGKRLKLLLLATALSLIALWGVLRDIVPLLYLGLIGGYPMLLVNGLHGGISPGRDVIGYSVFIVVNTAFYYVIFWVIARIWSKARTNVT
jgi:hypothetical protein